MSYFGLRPQLSIVQEDSREQEAEMESTGSLENESDRRSCDQIHATYSANDHRPSVSDLNLDSNFEMILMSPSTSPPPYSDKNIIAFVWYNNSLLAIIGGRVWGGCECESLDGLL